ncbi:MAG: hypothetical protein IKU10_06080 [Clostridia bacterium]|nr:hypothetical protein [Clostridia bacterium]
MSRVIIGADGGGTKTAWIAMDVQSGQVIAKATGKSIHAVSLGLDKALEHLQQGIEKLQLAEDDRICAIGLGDPAIDDTATTNESGEPLRQAVTNLYGCPCFSKSDVFMALYAFTKGQAGAFLVAGTGSMGVALPLAYCHRSEHNPVTTVGGWGDPTWDPGSGCDIAVQAICLALKAFDGVGQPTDLCQALLDFYQVKEPRDLIGILNAEGITRGDLACFARQVDACAQKGDAVATAILENAAQSLAAYGIRLLEGMDHPNLGVYGSVLLKNQQIRNRFEQLLLHKIPTAIIRVPEHPPEYGAVLFAADALEIDRRNW